LTQLEAISLETLWLASRTKPDSDKRYMTWALTGDRYLRLWRGAGVAPI